MERLGRESGRRPDTFRTACILQDILVELTALASIHPGNAQIKAAVRQTEGVLGQAIAARGFR